jgi:formylglycine-generating enzyme required for sulfatase activity
VKAGWANTSSKLKTGIIVAAAGLLLVSFIGFAILRMPLFTGRPNPTMPVGTPTATGVGLEEPTSVPEETFTPKVTQQMQNPAASADEMMLVPAGQFTMGGKAADEVRTCSEVFASECQLAWFVDEEPEHMVALDAFYIDIYEVTNARYQDCEQQGACDPPMSSASNSHPSYYSNPEFDNYPVINVDWYQAQAYCKWRAARLPTEAEWEKAARGTDGRMYPWGNKLDETFANFHWSVSDTTAVGSYESGKSPYGLYDMAGNVWEWVNSLLEPYPYSADDGRESPNGSGPRVMRGGSWGLEGDTSVSVSIRFGYDAARSGMDIGFRCARNANS